MPARAGERQMRRRDFMAFVLGSAAVSPAAALAQQVAATRRIGMLSPFTSADSAPWYQAFVRGLRDLGWLDGTNIAIEYRYADGHNDRLPGLIAELIGLKVEIV